MMRARRIMLRKLSSISPCSASRLRILLFIAGFALLLTNLYLLPLVPSNPSPCRLRGTAPAQLSPPVDRMPGFNTRVSSRATHLVIVAGHVSAIDSWMQAPTCWKDLADVTWRFAPLGRYNTRESRDRAIRGRCLVSVRLSEAARYAGSFCGAYPARSGVGARRSSQFVSVYWGPNETQGRSSVRRRVVLLCCRPFQLVECF